MYYFLKKPHFWPVFCLNLPPNFLKNELVHVILRLCTKTQENPINRPLTKSKNPLFGHFWAHIGPKKFFSKNDLIHILNNVILRLCTKNQENLINGPLTKSKKPFFWAFLGPNWPKKIFSRKMKSFIF